MIIRDTIVTRKEGKKGNLQPNQSDDEVGKSVASRCAVVIYRPKETKGRHK